MNNRKKMTRQYILKLLPLVTCVVLIACYLFSDHELTVQAILNFTPTNQLLAAIVMILLYAVKSFSIVIPLLLLQTAAGCIFSPHIALLVNILGVMTCHTIPYWIGHYSGSDIITKFRNKYPKLNELVDKQHENSAFVCFFLRIGVILPGDVVSMYLGASNTPFVKYLLFSLLGTLPGIVSATLLGASISDPTSPMFLISATMTIVLAGTSLVIQYLKKHRRR